MAPSLICAKHYLLENFKNIGGESNNGLSASKNDKEPVKSCRANSVKSIRKEFTDINKKNLEGSRPSRYSLRSSSVESRTSNSI